MKAMVFTEYDSPDVLHLKDVPKPIPKEMVSSFVRTITSIGSVLTVGFFVVDSCCRSPYF